MAVSIAREGRAESETALSKRLAASARLLLTAAGLPRRELSLLLTDDARMRQLNLTWRGEDKPTDVLSFPLEELAPEAPRKKSGPLGDIVLSLETVAADAVTLGWERDLLATFLLVHGFCHLLGHDHGEPAEAARMKADEDRFFALLAPGAVRPPTPY